MIKAAVIGLTARQRPDSEQPLGSAGPGRGPAQEQPVLRLCVLSGLVKGIDTQSFLVISFLGP